jgi:hypothetical protein
VYYRNHQLGNARALIVALLAVTSTLPAAALATAALAGAVRGNFTLIQATAVSDRWGTRAFGTVNGIFLAPVTIATALAPGTGTILARWLGTPQNAFFLLAGLAAVGSTLALATRASSGQPPASRRLTAGRPPLEGPT